MACVFLLLFNFELLKDIGVRVAFCSTVEQGRREGVWIGGGGVEGEIAE